MDTLRESKRQHTSFCLVLHNAEVTQRGSKVGQLGQNSQQVAVAHTAPAAQRGGKLFDGGGGQQAALVNVVGPIDGDYRRRPILALAFDSTAQRTVHAAPAMVVPLPLLTSVRPKSDAVNKI